MTYRQLLEALKRKEIDCPEKLDDDVTIFLEYAEITAPATRLDISDNHDETATALDLGHLVLVVDY